MQVKYRRMVFFALLGSFLIYSVIIARSPVEREPLPMSDNAWEGKLLYQQFNCTACHQFYGLGGYMGPDLTNVMSAPGKGEDFARALLKHGSAGMPDFGLSDHEIDALVEYLSHVDQTGQSPLRDFTVNLDGSVNLVK